MDNFLDIFDPPSPPCGQTWTFTEPPLKTMWTFWVRPPLIPQNIKKIRLKNPTQCPVLYVRYTFSWRFCSFLVKICVHVDIWQTPPSPLVDKRGHLPNPPSPLLCPHGLWMPPYICSHGPMITQCFFFFFFVLSCSSQPPGVISQLSLLCKKKCKDLLSQPLFSIFYVSQQFRQQSKVSTKFLVFSLNMVLYMVYVSII